MQMRVKVTESDGLLFYVGEEGTGDWGDYLAIGLTDGHLQMGYNLGDGEIIAKDNFSRIDDGHWHLIKVERSVIQSRHRSNCHCLVTIVV